MKQLFLACFVVLAAAVQESGAQIAITRNQIEAVFTPGSTVRVYVDSSSQTLNVGRMGGPNTYDLSSLPFYFEGRDTNFNASQLPNLAPRYPSGSNVLQFIPDPSFRSYFLSSFSATQMSSPGEAFVADPNIEDYLHRTPAGILAMFPVTYNSSFNQTFVSEETTYVGGVPFFTSSFSTTTNTFVDGFGTLLLPGLTLNCLRMRAVDDPPNQDKEFRFITQDGAIVLISSFNTEPDTGVVNIEGITMLLGGPLSSVQHSTGLPDAFSLQQNYPNPFNPGTTILYELPTFAYVSLKVYDVLGRVVATLADEVQGPGRKLVAFDGSSLSSGVYVYRLAAGHFVFTRKMLLLK